ncbi:MAG: transcriptional regulator [Gammaproteobacteria bacterium]|nr:transcriptional regulator [Gammaproteobacteria bacterium]MBU1725667.1 transcriptional regulator [Gammaproteobacteria bacterium]MBU2003981.1 transcriptional regulator [Gammaproteobacteria bacterium]
MRQPDRRLMLKQRKQVAESAWERFVNGYPLLPGDAISLDIARSWQRSLQYLSPWKLSVPLVDNAPALWEVSPLNQAIQHIQAELVQLVEEGALALALADASGRLLWTTSSHYMRDRVERAHYLPGGRWDEISAGTNAIGLALLHKRKAVVFASEHYARCLHDWVSYAIPIVHSRSGELAGVLGIVTTWDKHTPLGEMAISDLARSIQRHLPATQPQAELQIHALGMPRVLFRGEEIHLSQRQMEILCLLVLNPQGLVLTTLHSALYGDEPIAMATLKAELSHLRSQLGGQIGSRPYRLLVSTWADFVTLWRVLKDKKAEKALGLYRGPFLPNSNSPELGEWRNCIDAVMEKVVDACDDPEVLLESLSHGSQGSGMVRERLVELTSGAGAH